jgi:hypothetical protein
MKHEQDTHAHTEARTEGPSTDAAEPRRFGSGVRRFADFDGALRKHGRFGLPLRFRGAATALTAGPRNAARSGSEFSRRVAAKFVERGSDSYGPDSGDAIYDAIARRTREEAGGGPD